jgi:hypothetical protein
MSKECGKKTYIIWPKLQETYKINMMYGMVQANVGQKITPLQRP